MPQDLRSLYARCAALYPGLHWFSRRNSHVFEAVIIRQKNGFESDLKDSFKSFSHAIVHERLIVSINPLYVLKVKGKICSYSVKSGKV